MAVKGLKNVINNIKKLNSDIQKEIRLDVEEYTDKILRQAIQNAPGAGDRLKTQFGTQVNDTNIQEFLDKEITNNGFTGIVFIESRASLLAIYIEFGTGASAAGYVPTLPDEWQRQAMQYYINGKGTLVKQPFLLPAFFKYQFEFLKALQKSLESKGVKTVLIP